MKGGIGKIVIAAIAAAAVGAAGATAGQQAATAGQGYKVVGKWGADGSANRQFLSALGIATDASGLVYVADQDNHRIQVFTSSGGFVRKWGSEGDGNGQFVNVRDVAIAPDGSVWAADLKNGRVQQFSKDGGFQTALGTPKQAWGVAVDTNGNVYASTAGDDINSVVRFDKTATGYSGATTFAGGFDTTGDVEVSPDGSIYVVDSASNQVRRYDSSGKLLKTFRGGQSLPLALGVDLDCNVWIGNISQRRIDRYSPQGKLLGSATSPDLIAQDIAVGPRGDLYAVHNSPNSVIHFAEDKKKPATANVPGAIKVAKGKATIAYRATGIACPAQVDAVATLSGGGVSGRAAVKVAAGKTTAIPMNVKGPAGKTAKATFTIVLSTNGRKTTEKKSVTVRFAK